MCGLSKKAKPIKVALTFAAVDKSCCHCFCLDWAADVRPADAACMPFVCYDPIGPGVLGVGSALRPIELDPGGFPWLVTSEVPKRGRPKRGRLYLPLYRWDGQCHDDVHLGVEAAGRNQPHLLAEVRSCPSAAARVPNRHTTWQQGGTSTLRHGVG
eukprot:5608465-Amphidinium_carterae.1